MVPGSCTSGYLAVGAKVSLHWGYSRWEQMAGEGSDDQTAYRCLRGGVGVAMRAQGEDSSALAENESELT
jgi:hypothetical protein